MELSILKQQLAFLQPRNFKFNRPALAPVMTKLLNLIWILRVGVSLKYSLFMACWLATTMCSKKCTKFVMFWPTQQIFMLHGIPWGTHYLNSNVNLHRKKLSNYTCIKMYDFSRKGKGNLFFNVWVHFKMFAFWTPRFLIHK